MRQNIQYRPGFTLTELLIVIVIIAILAAISIVAYNCVQDRSRKAKINSDLTQLERAILASRQTHPSGEVALRYVTGSQSTVQACVTAPVGGMRDQTAYASCWASYTAALNNISTISGINVRGLVDPWGRPYFLDENEKEGVTMCGTGKDRIGVFPNPRAQNSWVEDEERRIPYITPGC